MVEKNIKQYLNNGKNLTLLIGKKPTIKNWTETKISEEKLYAHSGNIGWVIGPCDLVIDVDPKNGGEKSFNKLLRFLKKNDPTINLEPTVLTPSGGFHIYLEIPEKYANRKFKKTLNNDYPGIDFLTKGSQCVIPSSKNEYEWKDSSFGKFEQFPVPDSLISLLSYESKNENVEYFSEFIEDVPYEWSENKVKTTINKLDPSMKNDEWVKVGMALHNWNPIKGLEIWEEWSKGGDNYVEGDTDLRWKSFTAGKGVTLGTVSHMAKKIDYDETIEKVKNYIEQIKFSNEQKLEFDLIPLLKMEDFSKVSREKLVKAIQDKYKDLAGVKMPINDIREMITPNVVKETYMDDTEKPEWCNNWVYVNSHAGFINLQTLSLHKSESFNIENGKYVPKNEGVKKLSATKFVSDEGFVKKVDTMAYLPSYKGTIRNIDGFSILNSFNHKSVPTAATQFTNKGIEAIEIVKKHIKFICTTNEDSDIFTQWLAHQVQCPGRQVLWSPVIQSIQGVGKSFFGELLRSCLGDRNIGTVSPSQVVNEFNGWATNVLVNILEELRVKGHNRYDAVNALKPLITDRIIQINDKGIKQYMTYNTTNYMCFTNHKDALPLDEDDRRWWVLFVPIQCLKELPDFVGEDSATYFPNLFNAVRNNGPEIRKWLLEYNITADFINTKRAPMTKHKLGMMATEDAGFDGLIELKELIKKGGKFFNENVISSSDLFETLLLENPTLDIQTIKRNILLKKLGYMLLPDPIKIDGKTRRVWAKTQISNNEVKNLMFEKKLN